MRRENPSQNVKLARSRASMGFARDTIIYLLEGLVGLAVILVPIAAGLSIAALTQRVSLGLMTTLTLASSWAMVVYRRQEGQIPETVQENVSEPVPAAKEQTAST